MVYDRGGEQDRTRWQGKVWTFHDSIKYEFDLEFDIP